MDQPQLHKHTLTSTNFNIWPPSKCMCLCKRVMVNVHTMQMFMCAIVCKCVRARALLHDDPDLSRQTASDC